jgi:hypothetical protein
MIGNNCKILTPRPIIIINMVFIAAKIRPSTICQLNYFLEKDNLTYCKSLALHSFRKSSRQKKKKLLALGYHLPYPFITF